MNFPSRRKPLALLFYYGFASALVSAYAPEALAQAPLVLRIDPALLGLPPIKPGEAPIPVPVPTPAEKPRAEVKPIEVPVVEARPVEAEPEMVKPAKASKAPAPDIPERTVAPPPAAPVVAKPSRAPAPAEAVSPVVAVPARNPREEEERQAAPVAPVLQPARQPEPVVQPPVPAMAAPVQVTRPVAQPPAQAVASVPTPRAAASSLAPLHVDPALLGPAPATAATATYQSSAVSGSSRPSPVAVASPVQTSGGSAPTAPTKPAGADRSWFQRIWDPVANAYSNGALEFYLPLVTYHSRSTYSAEQIASYQERPLGFGIGRGLYNEKGNWEGVFAMAFQDSHFKPSYTAGYQWKAIWRPTEDVRLGLGYLAGLMSRADIIEYIPFPILFPVASVAYKNFSLEGTYIPPGGQNAGNVLFIWAKWELGKKGEAIGTPAPPAPQVPTEMANSSFGRATPLAQQKVPYGPVFDEGSSSRLASSAETVPPQVPATGWRDEDEVPDVLPPLALRASKAMVPLAKDSAVPRPVFLSSHRMGGAVDREFIAEGDAELRKIGTVVNADRLTYWPIDDEVEAEGNVHLEQGADQINGPKMRLKMEDQVGFFEQPSYTIKRQPQPGSKAAADKAYAESFAGQQGDGSWLTSGFASPRALNIRPGQTTFKDSTKSVRAMTEARGEADRLDFEGENQFRLTNNTYTTCEPGNNDWYAKTSTLKLDYDREVGEGTDGTVYFLGAPILYSPWLSFSLNNQRKSGFLSPTFGTNSDSGIEFSLPYYWNIAPNMDVTITPRVMTKRGVEVSNEFRYLNSAYGALVQSKTEFDVLPDDKLRDGDNRYLFSLLHTQPLPNGFAGSINYTKVSDDNYFTDLTTNLTKTSQVNLLQQGVLSYTGGGGWWTAITNVQSYQTLQPDPKNLNREPYRMLPQITVNARKPDFFMTDSSFIGQYTHFTRPDQIYYGAEVAGDSAQRTVLYPSVALPFVTPGWYVTPKIGVNIRNYALSGQAAGTPDSISSTLPIASIDSGMTFERPSNWFGRDYTQTLEPRLYYLNIPYKNQDEIPIYDTGLTDFNFAQIFSENQFAGWDRINNANQLTAAATTRLIEPSTGNEIMRAMLGQRFYFTQSKVGLTPTTAPADDGKWEKSDFLAAFSGQILPRVYADTAVQYNLSNREVKRYSLGARYQPEPGKVLNAAYRYYSDPNVPIDQIDLSGQWPITGRWHAVGRINYSFKDVNDTGTTIATSDQGGRLIESIAGLEYSGGCWVVRGVVQRIALTQDTTSTAFFIQLELSDFSRIGSNPLNLLKRNIQGYSLINQQAADPVFGD